ncbi:M81 family metallopeptidase [Pedobacter gandavensis]|uniref:M81 family metallopeptidase n=1 Tax=Pedobacter gandavensis TaxID=2679963 RepID=UPI00247A2009|nr:M81 family metallopeptidase [Pedobacter gandavensis]WGQ10596.1 M81 family metallopeptidase [Pedobacter gandavensis]
MKKRVAILGIYHESNTFSKGRTSWSDFAEGHLFYGSEIVDRYEQAHHEIAGFMEGMASADVELIPIFFADIIPGGRIDKLTYDRLKFELLTALEPVLPLDAIYVAAHGAAVSEEIRDVDGDWLQELRKKVGQETPILGSLDPHANVSMAMQEATDALIAYATNPHLDQRMTGRKVADLLKKILFDQIQIKQELIQFPAVISIEQQETAVNPCRALYADVQELLNQDGIISHSIILGFPYADVPEMGTALILISEASFDTTGLKIEIRKLFQSYFPQFIGTKIEISELLAEKDNYEKPVLLLDMGDNVGGGAQGNSTFLLDAIEAAGLSNACICIHAAALVEKVVKFEPGDWLLLDLNAGNPANRKAPYEVCVQEIKQGKFRELIPRHGGQVDYDMGQTVLVKTKSGNFIVLSSIRVPPFSAEQLRIYPIVLEELDWIIAKGVNAPIAAYRDICPTYFKVHTPGECNADATQFKYHYRRKPMFPFEQIDNYA